MKELVAQNDSIVSGIDTMRFWLKINYVLRQYDFGREAGVPVPYCGIFVLMKGLVFFLMKKVVNALVKL